MTTKPGASRTWWAAFAMVCFLAFAPGTALSADTPSEPNRSVGATRHSVAGTRWSGFDSEGINYVYVFELDGSLSYQSPAGFFRKDGTWNQSGQQVYMEINGRFSMRLGEISGKMMQGRGWNKDGHKWTWTVTKDEPAMGQAKK